MINVVQPDQVVEVMTRLNQGFFLVDTASFNQVTQQLCQTEQAGRKICRIVKRRYARRENCVDYMATKMAFSPNEFSSLNDGVLCALQGEN
jgi:hypothetical protein